VTDSQVEDDLDLEFYELRDEAVKRVALKRSVQIHFAVWAVLNIFLVALNLTLVNFRPMTLNDFWTFWTLFCWGFGLYVHATVWFTIDVQGIGKRMFFIHCLIALGLIPLLASINLLTTPAYHWFWWVLGGELAFLFIQYYITFISTGPNRLESAIQREIELLRKRASSRDQLGKDM